MKNFISFFSIILFWGNIAIADQFDFPLNSDVGDKTKYHKSLVSYNFKDYGVKIVNKSDGHPVRSGNQSIRFEIRDGDCGTEIDGKWDDCTKDRQRHELSSNRKLIKNNKDHWTFYSIYLPEDFKNLFPLNVGAGQFHQYDKKTKKSRTPVMKFDFGYSSYQLVPFWTNDNYQLIKIDDMRGKWTDVLINAKFTHKENGYLKIWINQELKFEYEGKTIQHKSIVPFFKFGIYHTFLSRWKRYVGKEVAAKGMPTQIIYFDEVRHANKKNKVLPK